MEKILIKKIVIISVLAIIIILLGLYFYFFRTNQEAKPFYKDGNFEFLKPAFWSDAESSLSPDPFYRENLKIISKRFGTVGEQENGCFLRISKAETDGDFFKKATLYKNRLLFNTNHEILKEEGLNPGSYYVFLKFLLNESDQQGETRIYLVNNKMYFVGVLGQRDEEQCELFLKNISSLIKISDAQ